MKVAVTENEDNAGLINVGSTLNGYQWAMIMIARENLDELIHELTKIKEKTDTKEE